MLHQCLFLLLLDTLLIFQGSGNLLRNNSSLLNNQCVTREEVQSIADELRSEIQATYDEIQASRYATQAVINARSHETQASINATRTEILTAVRTTLRFMTSCKYVSPGGQSGNYWIQQPGSTPQQVYCDMTRRCCNTTGWMRVANLDMTDPSQQCPSGFRLVTSPVRTCGRPGRGCISTIFPVHGVEYSRVCGRIKAYQYFSMDAFDPYNDNPSLTIDDLYVDGISLTHGRYPRKHIWTFANGHDESTFHSDHWQCPCSNTDAPHTGVVPPFIGQDYFCDTAGSEGGTIRILYTNDPLWDGQGCGPRNSCCTFHNPPWFCKQLPQPTSDDIELRLCADQDINNEDSRLEIVEIYIQ